MLGQFFYRQKKTSSLKEPLLSKNHSPDETKIPETKIDIKDNCYIPPVFKQNSMNHDTWEMVASYFTIEDAIDFALSSKENQKMIKEFLNQSTKYHAMMSVKFPHHLSLVRQAQVKRNQVRHLLQRIDNKIQQKTKCVNDFLRFGIGTLTLGAIAGMGWLMDTFSPEDKEGNEMSLILGGGPSLSIMGCMIYSWLKTNKYAILEYKFINSFLFPFTQEQLSIINENGPLSNKSSIQDAVQNLTTLESNLEVIIKQPADEILKIKKCLPDVFAKTDLLKFSCVLFKDLFKQNAKAIDTAQSDNASTLSQTRLSFS